MPTIQPILLLACPVRPSFSLTAPLSNASLLKMRSTDEQRGHHLGACQKWRISGPTPDLCNQSLHLTKSPGDLHTHWRPALIDLTNSKGKTSEDPPVPIVTRLCQWQPIKKLAEWLQYYPQTSNTRIIKLLMEWIPQMEMKLLQCMVLSKFHLLLIHFKPCNSPNMADLWGYLDTSKVRLPTALDWL